jgi:hypothetical protein
MNRIVTNWENDMIAEPEEMVKKFLSEKRAFWDFKHYDVKLLSGLRHRDIGDIYASLEESRVIIMQPSLLDKEQIKKIVQAISHPIHGNNFGAQRRWEIRDFIFLSANPFEDLNFIIDACRGVIDQHKEVCLQKILLSCEVHFFGFNDEHYELKCNRLDSPYAIRHK